MSSLSFSAQVILMVWTNPGEVHDQAQTEGRATCHLALGIENLTKPAETYKDDIHAAKGFGCVACAGGELTIVGLEAKDRKKGYIGKPVGTRIIDVCGKCHADASFMRRYNPSLRVNQVTEYFTSVHGRRLKDQKDQKVLTCASCHRPHSMRPASDARSSVHPTHVAKILSGLNDCHRTIVQ